MNGVSEVDQVIGEAAFSSFLKWVAVQPNVEVVQAELQLVNDALDGQVVDRRTVREALVFLADVAQYGPYAEIMVQMFDFIRAQLEEGE
jgi:hypothetical protein